MNGFSIPPTTKLERLRVLQTLIAHLGSHEDGPPGTHWHCPLAGELNNIQQLVRVLTELRDEIVDHPNGRPHA
ncbi:MAG: hypothetical protein AB1716_03405 [Planctomycetota bacterium]